MKAYRAQRAFDGEQSLIGGALVLVDGGRIVAVQPAAAPVPDGVEVTEVPGATLLPGLIDTHVHLCADDSPTALDKLADLPDADLDAAITASLLAQRSAGVTTVRDLGDRRFAVLDRRDSAAAWGAGTDGGPLPRILASGPPITTDRGHCWNMGGEVPGTLGSPERIAGLRTAVAERVERGVDVVKVMSSGGVMTPDTDPAAAQFALDELRAVVEEAHACGVPVTAHAHALVAVENCVAAGVDGIEHCSCFTPSGLDVRPPVLPALAASGIAVSLTMGQFDDAPIPERVKAVMDRLGFTVENRLQQAAGFIEAGVRLIGGADAGIGPSKRHGVVVRAVAEHVTAGMGGGAALALVTSASADAIGLGDVTGRLRPGLAADLLFVDGDPVADAAALGSPRLVVVRGTPVPLG